MDGREHYDDVLSTNVVLPKDFLGIEEVVDVLIGGTYDDMDLRSNNIEDVSKEINVIYGGVV